MKYLFAIALFIYTASYGQSIKKNEYDKFLKAKIIETSSVTIYGDYLTGASMSLQLKAVDSIYLLIVTGSNKAVGVVGKNDDFIFLLENDETVTVNPTSIQDYDNDYSTIGSSTLHFQNYYHVYKISKEDILALEKSKIKKVRVYYNSVYDDIDVKEKHAKDFIKLCKVFQSATFVN